ncbi:hypothetical protein JTB14_009850 [Gonioctena quinquepunctata]|nr:hypothetical protein JTB14_009850 [Gonioctena quinquepunctata]
MEPPEPNVLTDEDSGDGDDGALVDNLNRQQLRSQVDIVLPDNEIIDGNEEIARDGTLHNGKEIGYECSRHGKHKITWINGDIVPRNIDFPKPDLTRFRDQTFVDIFEKFIDDDIIFFLVEESTRYALFVNGANPKISPEEMKCFIAILNLTGYCELPGSDFRWDSRDDMTNRMVSQAIRGDRFRQILKYLHCADNTKPDLNDKMWKLRPLMIKVKANLKKLGSRKINSIRRVHDGVLRP